MSALVRSTMQWVAKESFDKGDGDAVHAPAVQRMYAGMPSGWDVEEQLARDSTHMLTIGDGEGGGLRCVGCRWQVL